MWAFRALLKSSSLSLRPNTAIALPVDVISESTIFQRNINLSNYDITPEERSKSDTETDVKYPEQSWGFSGVFRDVSVYSLGTSKLVKENTFNANYFYLRKLKSFMEHLGK